MNKLERAAATLAVMAAGILLGAALAWRLPFQPEGLVADRSLVCMVNDRVMAQPQLPVLVQGRTYFGCCAGCVDRLNRDRTARVAVDPVSGREVDKSQAVMLQDEGARVLYFENLDTAARFRRSGAAGS